MHDRMRDRMHDIEWVFFDVGSTLVDETTAYDNHARSMLAKAALCGRHISFEQFDAMRRRLALEGLDGNSAARRHFGLEKTPWPSHDEVPFSDAVPTLSYLKSKGYRLGVIANQPVGTADRLASWGMLGFFDVVVSSAEAGVSKPSPEIFLMAMESASCEPARCLMVGDRLDNDIKPAKALGMATAWMRTGLAAIQDPSFGDGVADCMIDSLGELTKVL